MDLEMISMAVWAILSAIWFFGSIYLAVEERVKDPKCDISDYTMSALTAPLAAPIVTGMAVFVLIAVVLMFPLEQLVKVITSKRQGGV